MAPPANDVFASATSISGATGTILGTTFDATWQSGEPTTLGNSSIQSVWYTFTAPSTGWFKFWLPWNLHTYHGIGVGDDYTWANMAIIPNGTLATMTSTNALSYAQSYGPSPNSVNSGDLSMLVELTSGSLYKIKIWAVFTGNTYTFDYTLQWSDIASIEPANNNFANRIDLGAIPVQEVLTSPYDASTETSETISNSPDGWTREQSVWYSFTPSATGNYVIEVPYGTVTYDGAYLINPLPIQPVSSLLSIGTGTPSAFTSIGSFKLGEGTTPYPRLYVTLTSGVEYLIKLAAPWNPKTFAQTFGYNYRPFTGELNIDLAPSAPANNDFANAEELVGSSGTTSGTTLYATQEAGEPNYQGANNQSVWYKITPSTTGFWKFTIPVASLEYVGDSPTSTATSGSLIYTIFDETVDTVAEAERTLTTLPDSFNEDGVSPTSTDGHVGVQLYAGNTYYIKVFSSSSTPVSNDNVVNFDLEWEFVTGPANDLFANAIALTLPANLDNQTVVDAAAEDGEDENQMFSFGQDQSVWYKFIPSTSGKYRVFLDNIVENNIFDFEYDIGIFLMNGTTIGGLTEIDSSIYSSGPPSSLANRWDLDAGTTYYIKIATSNFQYQNTTTFDFDLEFDELEVAPAPPNDNLADATDLGVDPISVSVTGNNQGATNEIPIEGDINTPSTWYRFTSSTTQQMRITLTKTGDDPDWVPYAEIYEIITDPPASFDDLSFVEYLRAPSDTANFATWSFEVEAGKSYVVYVTNWNGDGSGDQYRLDISAPTPPTNDEITSPTTIPRYTSPGGTIISGNSIEATESTGVDSEDSENIGPAMWYRWEAPAGADLARITFISDEEDHVINVWTSDVENPANVSEITDPGFITATVDLPDTPTDTWALNNTYYYIEVEKFEVGGDFSFKIEVPPNNDEKGNFSVIPSQPRGYWSGQNVDATFDAAGGEPIHGGVGDSRSVWFSYNMQHIGEYTFQIDRVWGDLVDPVISVYRGNIYGDYDDLIHVASGTDTPLPSVTFTSIDEDYFEDYAIVVSSRTEDSQGGFALSWVHDSVEDNDNFEDAEVISGTGSVTNRTLNGSMFEIDDLELFSFSSNSANHWYKFTPSVDGSFYLNVTSVASTVANRPVEIYIWKGANTKEEMIAQAHFTASTIAPRTEDASIPVDANQDYYIEVISESMALYSMDWILNDDVGVDTTISDFTAAAGGVFEDLTLYPEGHLREIDPLYIGFNVKYSNSNRVTQNGSLIPIMQLFDTEGTAVFQVYINSTGQWHSSNDAIRFRSDAVSSSVCSEEPVFVEVLISRDDLNHFAVNSQREAVCLINGEPQVDFNTEDEVHTALETLRIGFIDNTGGHTVSLDFSDIRVKTLSDDQTWPDPPTGSSARARVLHGSGLHAQGIQSLSSSSNFYSPVGNWLIDDGYQDAHWLADPTGRGDYVFDCTTEDRGWETHLHMRIPERRTVSWWLYLTSMPSNSPSCELYRATWYVQTDNFASERIALLLQNDGTMILNGPNARSYSHRLMETGSWHHFEVEIIKLVPQIEMRWWIDGEEQAPFMDSRSAGRTFVLPNDSTIGILNVPGGNDTTIKGYLTDMVCGLKGPIGPAKSTQILPNSTGTHSLGVVVIYTDDSGTETFIKSSDDNATYTSLGPTEAIHDHINEWPIVDGVTSDVISQANRNGYVEYGWGDIGDETILHVNNYFCQRSMHIMDGGLLLIHTFSDFLPNSRDQTPTGPMFAEQRMYVDGEYTFGINDYTSSFDGSRRFVQLKMNKSPTRELWTPTLLNSMISQWGFQRFLFGGRQQGNAFLGSMTEVIMEDEYPDITLDIYVPPAPEIYIASEQIGELFGTDQPVEFNSCDAWGRNDLRTDPFMKSLIYFEVLFEQWEDESMQLQWKMDPPYLTDEPGFNGEWTTLAYDQKRWQDGEWMPYITRIPGWKDREHFHTWVSDPRLFDDHFLYNPCSLGSLVDENNEITFYARQVDAYGVESAEGTAVVTITKGNCCGGIHLSRIKFRSWGDQEF